MAQDKDKKTLNVPPLRFPGFTDEWKEYTVDEITKVYGRIGFRGYTTADLVEKGMGAISLSPSNIINNRLYTNKDNTYISFSKYEESPEIKIYEGDVIFVKTGSTVGKVAYVDRLECEATLNPQLIVFKEIKCDNYLFSQILSTNNLQQRIAKITVGGAVPTLSQTELGKVRLSLPKEQEQSKLTSLLSLLDERIATQNKIIDNLKSLIKGLAKTLTQQKQPNTRICDCLDCHTSTLQESMLEDSGKFPVYGASGIVGYLDDYSCDEDSILIIKDGSGVGTVSQVSGKYSGEYSSVTFMPNISPPKTILGSLRAEGAIRESASTVVEDGKSNSLPLLKVKLYSAFVLLTTLSITGPYCVNSSPYSIHGRPVSDNCSFDRFITEYSFPKSFILTARKVLHEL